MAGEVIPILTESLLLNDMDRPRQREIKFGLLGPRFGTNGHRHKGKGLISLLPSKGSVQPRYSAEQRKTRPYSGISSIYQAY